MNKLTYVLTSYVSIYAIHKLCDGLRNVTHVWIGSLVRFDGSKYSHIGRPGANLKAQKQAEVDV